MMAPITGFGESTPQLVLRIEAEARTHPLSLAVLELRFAGAVLPIQQTSRAQNPRDWLEDKLESDETKKRGSAHFSNGAEHLVV